MAVAIVTIAGRSYRLGCDEGQEKRLEELAASVDGKIAAMRSSVGEIGDQRLVVMAAIEIADEAADARAKIETLEAEVASLREKIDAGQRRDAAIETRLAKSFDAAATRLERLAQQLAGDIGEVGQPAVTRRPSAGIVGQDARNRRGDLAACPPLPVYGRRIRAHAAKKKNFGGGTTSPASFAKRLKRSVAKRDCNSTTSVRLFALPSAEAKPIIA